MPVFLPFIPYGLNMILIMCVNNLFLRFFKVKFIRQGDIMQADISRFFYDGKNRFCISWLPQSFGGF